MTTNHIPHATAPSAGNNGLIYQLDDCPAFVFAILTTLRHLLASILGLKTIFGSSITIDAFSAILLNFFLPEERLPLAENAYAPVAHLHSALPNPQNAEPDHQSRAPNDGLISANPA